MNSISRSSAKHAAYATLAALGILGNESVFNSPLLNSLSKPTKKCLLCGAEHSHNNHFCSAEHCREYYKKQKAIKLERSTK